MRKKSPVNDQSVFLTALVFINDHIETFSYPPSVREIGLATGYTSSSSAQKIVDALRRQKLIYIDSGIARGMRISENGYAAIKEIMQENA
jgi:SOS-response transcriptional repressor LexA